MALTQVQVRFVNDTVRPMLESLILFHDRLKNFVDDYDNQQSPLPTDATVLTDNTDGSAARADAPQLTGANVQSLRTFCANMRDQVTTANRNALIAVMVRDLNTVLRGG